MVRRLRSFSILAVALAVPLAVLNSNCGGSSQSPTGVSPTPTPVPTPTPTPTPTPAPTPTPLPPMTITISGEMGSNSFSPNPANVKVGQEIHWHNADGITHTATQNGSGFDTGNLSSNATSGPITIGSAGSVSYHCAVHPSMVGTLNVTQ
jgi:plastocyanin